LEIGVLLKEVILSLSLSLPPSLTLSLSLSLSFLLYAHTHTQDLPFWYPANVFQYLNGTDIPSNGTLDEYAVVGVKGIIPKNVYDEMLKVKHFNQTTPLDFHGYNIDGSYWPFWSSEPWTYAASMLALTQYRALNATGQL
jgi:hypothetical protein